MILNTKGVSQFSVDKRIDIKVTSFSFDLLSKYNPLELLNGRKVQYALKNLYGSTGNIIFNGRIDKIDDTIDPTKRIFNVTGRNVARYLEEQPFFAPCYGVSTNAKRTRSMQWLLDRIRTGTGCVIGSELLQLNQDFSNDPDDVNKYCGNFKSRSNAIDYLLQRYGELNGKPQDWFQWWVDTEGVIRLIDTTEVSNIPTVALNQFPSKGVLKIKIGLNTQAIENDVTVIGGKENDIRVRVFDRDSIREYGRNPADTITDSSLLSESAVRDRANKELETRTKEIWVGEITTVGFPQTECGLAMRLLFSERYEDMRFIFTNIKHQGRGGNYITSIGISTDKNVLVNPNLSDIISSQIKAQTTTNTLTEAKVTAVNTETGEVNVVPVGVMDNGIAMEQNAILAGGKHLSIGVL